MSPSIIASYKFRLNFAKFVLSAFVSIEFMNFYAFATLSFQLRRSSTRRNPHLPTYAKHVIHCLYPYTTFWNVYL